MTRPLASDLAMTWEAGSHNPDFIAVENNGTHWVVEPKTQIALTHLRYTAVNTADPRAAFLD